ncbi:MAG: NUDIX hydrolase, partial [Acidobacteria bacterium]|nr:NUDIX hydrolase [Acidobacteriota bacterium]
MIRSYPEAPVCAVGGIVFRGSTVLLIQRAKPPAQGKWSIPGGVIRLGENLEAAVAREIREEAGLEVRPVTVGKVVDRIFVDSDGKVAYHYVIIDYVCVAGQGAPQAGSDASAAAFFDVQRLDEIDMTDGTAAVIREVQRRWKASAE